MNVTHNQMILFFLGENWKMRQAENSTYEIEHEI